MDVVQPIWCGIDVPPARLTAWLRRVHEDGQVTQDVREFATTYPALRALRDGRHAAQGPVVALARPGVSWRPVSHGLVGPVDVRVGPPHAMRRRPGHKTDQAEARWMAARRTPGLIRPRCLPPRPSRRCGL